MVAQWPGTFLSGVPRMFSRCLCGFFPGSPVPLTVQKHACGGKLGTGSETETDGIFFVFDMVYHSFPTV